MLEFEGHVVLIEKDFRNWFAFECSTDGVWRGIGNEVKGHYTSCPLPLSHQAAIIAYKDDDQE
eukprot:CAMPEP_0116879170 /NCGR_PEP_ID=MMETSP0463-20121206/10947_1 /TAXON_ID=181622 /ORGANISM="Strombidinopsis sp, Strain SopsisLIS2011" /LENGTH=62 /DNA_ID=CAMNT_0004528177 /DNA_START=1177 /DNA_END=1365 /DNA_ORIENTATION=+